MTITLTPEQQKRLEAAVAASGSRLSRRPCAAPSIA
jgi:hypothetical protein